MEIKDHIEVKEEQQAILKITKAISERGAAYAQTDWWVSHIAIVTALQ